MKKLTMIRNRVHPFVESRVQFCDDVLLPLGTDEAKENFRLIYGILTVTKTRKVKGMSEIIRCELTIVRSENERICVNFRYSVKNESIEGFFAGCLKRRAGSG